MVAFDNCSDCPYPMQRTAQPTGNPFADILIVGEASGRNEILGGSVFAGRSGSILDATLEDVGLDRDDCHVTNTVLCRPPNNNTPSSEALEACSDRLESEIKETNPSYILPLGSTASKRILNTETGIHDLRGRVYYQNGRTIVPTFHPALCLRKESTYIDFHFDLDKLGKLYRGELEFPDLDDVSWSLIKSYSKLVEALEWLSDFDVVSCDTETTGLDWKTCDLISIGFGVGDGRSVIVDWDEMNNKKMAKFLLNEFFESGVEVIFHNGTFDYKVLDYQEGINPTIDFDTMLLHHVGIDERSGKELRSLGKLAKEWFNSEDWEKEVHEEFIKPDDKTLRDAPKEDQYYYLTRDVDATYRLWDEFWNKQMEESTRSAYQELIVPAIPSIIEMEMNGMEVDQAQLDMLKEDYSERIEKIEDDLIRLAKEHGWDSERYVEETEAKSEPDVFNPNSDQQMWHVLFDLFELPLFRGDRTAKKDARKEWMSDLDPDDDRYQFLDRFDEYKKLNKLYNTYIKGMERYIQDGRVHSDYNLAGTRGSRLSSSSPNLQNIPRKPEVKNIFRAPEGYKLMEVDLSQNELRTLAELSDDPFMKEVYWRGDDLHDQMTERIFGSGWNKGQRNIAKKISFSLLYGAGASKIAREVGASEKKAEQWIEYWAETAIEAWEFLEELGEAYKNQDYMETPHGRRLRFGLVTKHNKGDIINLSKNWIIQTTAWDLCMVGVNEVNHYLQCLDARLINAVHDAVTIEYREDLERRLVRVVPALMETAAESSIDSDIPWVADVEISDRGWGDCQEISKDSYSLGGM